MKFNNSSTLRQQAKENQTSSIHKLTVDSINQAQAYKALSTGFQSAAQTSIDLTLNVRRNQLAANFLKNEKDVNSEKDEKELREYSQNAYWTQLTNSTIADLSCCCSLSCLLVADVCLHVTSESGSHQKIWILTSCLCVFQRTNTLLP